MQWMPFQLMRPANRLRGKLRDVTTKNTLALGDFSVTICDLSSGSVGAALAESNAVPDNDSSEHLKY
jgi:hypothetical protein